MAFALCGPETALISLGIPKLVRFDKISPDSFNGIVILRFSDFEVQTISRGVQGWVEGAKPIRATQPVGRNKRSALRRTGAKAA